MFARIGKGLGGAAVLGGVAGGFWSETDPGTKFEQVPEAILRTTYWYAQQELGLNRPGIPYKPEHVTKEYLEHRLQSVTPTGKRVAKVSTEPLGDAHGYASSMCRAKVYFAPEDGDDTLMDASPTPFIVKMSSYNFVSRLYSRLCGLMQNEYLFFKNNIGVKAGMTTPKIISLDFDPISDNFTMVQEDLSHLVCPSQLTGASVETARAILVEIAKLNASHWNNSAALPWARSAKSGVFTFLKDAWDKDKGALLPWMEKVATQRGVDFNIPEGSHDAVELLFSHMDEVDKSYAQPGSFVEDGGPMDMVLVHGDARLENFFVDETPTGVDVTTIDFQLLTFDLPCRDAAYFIGQSLDTEVRRKHEVELLRVFYNTLQRHGDKSNTEAFSWKRCVLYYQVCALMMACLPYFWAKSTLGQLDHMSPADKKYTEDCLLKVSPRALIHVHELNGMELAKLFVKHVEGGKKFDWDHFEAEAEPLLDPRFFQEPEPAAAAPVVSPTVETQEGTPSVVPSPPVAWWRGWFYFF
eukprot:m.728413 g.728413  ORF g.728413 m.728413 type:complete len:524 (-) comp23045_c2_seq17:340-1911(-)